MASERINDGGPAFPHPQMTTAPGGVLEDVFGERGISVRDYFMAHAPEPTPAMLLDMERAAAKFAGEKPDETNTLKLDGAAFSERFAWLLARWRGRYAEAQIAERNHARAKGRAR